ISQFINMISEEAMNNKFDQAFLKVSNKIKEYPKCHKLILWSAQVLDGYLAMNIGEIEEKQKYQEEIYVWLRTVAFGEDVELSKAAMYALAGNLMRDAKYEEAQALIDKIRPIGFDKRVLQSQLFVLQDKYEDAYKTLEEMEYQQANGIVSSFMQSISILCKQKKYEKALLYAKKCGELARALDLGSYMEHSSLFTVYAEMQDKEKTIEQLEKMMDSFEAMGKVRESKLYEHMAFKKDDGLSRLREMFIKLFDQDRSLDFIKEEDRYKQLLGKIQIDEN
ncbi:MAG: hypothetical protein Q4F05_17515, partial [bacterium]|nr:hypothetical protein [bacterium]